MVEEEITRWGPVERVAHYQLIMTVPLLMLTGLPIFIPEYFSWVANALGGIDAVRIMHRILGSILIASAVAYLIYGATKGKTKVWPSFKDFKDAGSLMKYYLGIGKTRPRVGFHDPAAKLFEFWAGTIIAITLEMVTGVILAGSKMFPDITLFTDAGIRLYAQLLHDLAFFLLVVIGVLHIYFTLFRSDYRPAAQAMLFDGKVPAEWAKQHHPLWYEEVEKES